MRGIPPLDWVIDGANRNDMPLLVPTLDDVKAAGFFDEIGTLQLDRGYEWGAVRQRLVAAGIGDFNIQLRGTKEKGKK